MEVLRAEVVDLNSDTEANKDPGEWIEFAEDGSKLGEVHDRNAMKEDI